MTDAMKELKFFEVLDGYGCYRPRKRITLSEGIEMLVQSIVFAREQKIANLLIDTRQLTGYARPGTWERFVFGSRCAASAAGQVKVAVVARTEMIDPQRFGLTVARNRGLRGYVSDSEPAALAWLLDPNSV